LPYSQERLQFHPLCLQVLEGALGRDPSPLHNDHSVRVGQHPQRVCD
jgi:hypothetical protein